MRLQKNPHGFKLKMIIKYETEKIIYTKNSNLDNFKNKWALHSQI